MGLIWETLIKSPKKMQFSLKNKDFLRKQNCENIYF